MKAIPRPARDIADIRGIPVVHDRLDLSTEVEVRATGILTLFSYCDEPSVHRNRTLSPFRRLQDTSRSC